MQTTCTIDDCDRTDIRARGFCGKHYQRWRNNGTPDDTERTLDEAARFWAKVNKTAGCWEWLGTISINGYGRFPQGITNIAAHRWAFEHLVGSIPDGKFLDHLCRNRKCVRPDHLEPVTNRENILRGEAPTAVNARKTHCPQGHEYSPENTRLYRGYRYCKTCQREQGRARMAARRARLRGDEPRLDRSSGESLRA